jgi:hypothetical protein
MAMKDQQFIHDCTDAIKEQGNSIQRLEKVVTKLVEVLLQKNIRPKEDKPPTHKTSRHYGLRTYRFEANPEEERFALAWITRNEREGLLNLLLDPAYGSNGRSVDVDDRDAAVAATVIQWLGSPVGQSFLRDLGYTKPPRTSDEEAAYQLSFSYQGDGYDLR